MKSQIPKKIIALLLLLDCCLGFAQAQELTSDGLQEEINGLDSKPIQTISVSFNTASRNKVFSNPDPADASWPDEEILNSVINEAQAVASDRGKIAITGKNGVAIPFGSTLGTIDTLQSSTSGSVSASDCVAAATAWANGLTRTSDRGERSEDRVIVLDQNGSECWRSGTRITQGDYIYAGVFGTEGEVGNLKFKVDNCSLEPTTINVLDTTVGVQLQASGDVLKKFSPIECFDDQIDLQVLQANNALKFSHTLRQYKRYRGTFHIGILWTDLDEPNFTVTDRGSGPVIRSDIDDSTGPHYTASLVVYGIPHYLSALGGGRYSGRDIVNENSFSDRLGLALSFGLDDPKDTLGIGLSFEVATGINFTITQLYRRLNLLDGVNEGDAFSGPAESIPRKKTWEDELVFGLSIDGRYLMKFFDSKRS